MIPPDNPVWQALSSHQAHFNMGSEFLKFFPANVSPFVGMEQWNERALANLSEGLPANRLFSVMIAGNVNLPGVFEIVFTCPLFQMCCYKLDSSFTPNPKIRKLGYDDVPQMLDLTQKTKPGPFLERTIDMGNYYGIFESGRLVSLAGERLRLPGFTEISAICTDPSQLGKGLASILTAHVARQIADRGDIPFLHVKTDNERAISVYQRAGFDIRKEVFFAIFRRKSE